MSTGKRFFKIVSDVYDYSSSYYICREGSYDMYRINSRGTHYVELTGAANIEGAERLRYIVTFIDEEDLWPHKLWKGSFMRSKGKKK